MTRINGTDYPETTSEDRDGKNRLLDRRTCLRSIGATALAAGVTVVGSGTVTATDDYEVIEVGPGETWVYELSDGETFENSLIDITADGAEAELYARSNDWTVRNVGFTGTWDTYRRGQCIFAEVPDEQATGRIENVYLGDGAIGNEYPDGPNGIYVPPTHAGTLEIDTVNIQGMPDNAVYGSEPGRTAEHHGSPGSLGALEITNSYAGDCRAGGFRVGTDDCRIENCVTYNCDRAIWARFRNPTAIDCDMSESRHGDVSVGAGGWSSPEATTATLSVEDCRYETEELYTDTNEINGAAVSNPERTDPDEIAGVPVTATAAATGTADD